MVLLIGGAYQGKAAYARDVLGLAEDGVARVDVQALMEAPEGETAALEALCNIENVEDIATLAGLLN